MARGSIDSFHQRDALASLRTVAKRHPVEFDGAEEILKDGLVAANIGYRGGGCAQIGVHWGVEPQVWGRIAKIGGDDAIMLENDGAFRAGYFDSARLAWIRGGGGL